MRKIAVVLLLNALVVAGCGTDPNSDAPVRIVTCQPGEVANPVTGECDPGTSGPTTNPTTTVEDPTPNEGFSSSDPWAESDADGIVDREDNCPFADNPGQNDADGDGIGDTCDNCVNAFNTDQSDSSGSGVGDACAAQPVGDICGEQTTGFEKLDPNIYIVLDKSGSMDGNPMAQAKMGLDAIADELASEVQLGFGAFPVTLVCGQSHENYLPMGKYSPAQIKSSYRNIVPGGGTSTADALETVLRNRLTSAPNDQDDASRAKAVVLITDGEPNSCGELPGAINAAASLNRQGTPVYVIGFNFGSNPDNLNLMAEAGGTDAQGPGGARYYLANSANQLVAAIRAISSDVISCSYKLDATPEDPNKVWVAVNQQYLPRESYTIDPATNTVALNEASCDTLQASDPNSTNVQISMGCATECVPGEFWGCCLDEGESCSSDDECCFGSCNNGSCEAPCRPNGISCEENADCCSGLCGSDGNGNAICIVQ